MSYNLSTTNYRLQNANRLINDIVVANNYYFWYGSFLPQSNTSLQPIYDITSNVATQCWNWMIGGTQITSNNVYNVINNIQWTSGNIYSRYDDQDPNLPNEQFFVITTEGSYNHIWKVLDNNFAATSENQPLLAEAESTPYYQTSDGYSWKYMATTPSIIGNLYETSNYFPVISNTTVQEAATPGAIDVFALISNGAFYNNYVQGTFFATDINVNGSLVQYNISNNQASQVNGYYSGCLLSITAGAGQGQFANIISYVSNSTGNILTLANPLFPAPQNGSTYLIAPQVTLISGGQQTVNCVAYAVINSLASNSVCSIAVLQTGESYITVANSYIAVNSVVGITNNAILRAILPPVGGHGSNVFSELYSNSVGITVTLANSENNTILTQNDYQQIGLMNAPLFANVNIQFSTTSGNFLPEEIIYTITPSQMNANVTITANSSNVSCNNANFINQLAANAYIYLTGSTASQLAQVNSITNSSQITINSPALFSCTQSTMYSTVLTGSAIVSNVNQSNIIMVTNCTGISFQSGSTVVGLSSGINGIISSVTRNGINEFFQTFNQLTKYNATALNGTFQLNEQVQQGNNVAYLYGITGISSITMYFADFIGEPFTTGIVTGLMSGAEATITQGYQPDLVVESGNILYIENIAAVTRSQNQSEQFNLVLNL